jgi:hypothetical protein
MIAILIRYIHSRHLFASFISNSHTGSSAQQSGQHAPTANAAKIRVDKVLLFRFTIAFFILAAFEVTVVCFEFARIKTSAVLAAEDGPDWSTDSAVSEILLFMPGVTASLIDFLVFGTTQQYRQKYMNFFRSLRCACRRPKRSASNRSDEDGFWNELRSAGSRETYHCTIRAGGTPDPDADNMGKGGRVRTSVVVGKDDGLEIGRSLSQRTADLPQPWRTLGIPER